LVDCGQAPTHARPMPPRDVATSTVDAIETATVVLRDTCRHAAVILDIFRYWSDSDLYCLFIEHISQILSRPGTVTKAIGQYF
jgi:hypothetical protein